MFIKTAQEIGHCKQHFKLNASIKIILLIEIMCSYCPALHSNNCLQINCLPLLFPCCRNSPSLVPEILVLRYLQISYVDDISWSCVCWQVTTAAWKWIWSSQGTGLSTSPLCLYQASSWSPRPSSRSGLSGTPFPPELW